MGDFVRDRREAILLLSAAGAALAFGCGGSSPTAPTSTATTTTTATTGGTGTANATCAVAPTETVGPYPSLQDLIRSDIREDRDGTPLQLTIAVVNVAANCAPVAGVAVEIWQCDVAGDYSQYGTQRARTFLRGIQMTNDAGEVTFTTVYPGWYQGRATHIHVEVARAGQSIKVSQIAFPDEISNSVHTQGVYASRGVNSTSNTRDGIFSDSLSQQLATVSGSPATGMTASWRLGVAV